MDLPLTQLRAFVVLAEELHFGRAALRLGLSQPQVSRRVRALEAELGVELFVRTPRNTRMTETGRRLLEDAREALAATDRLRVRARTVAGDGVGRVAVGFVWSTLPAYLPRLVAAAPERHRDIELSVSQKHFVEIVPALRRLDVDLVISRTLHEPEEMVDQTLGHEPSMVAVPVGHPLATRPALTLADLDGQPLIALARVFAPALFDAVLEAARARGLDPRIAREVRSPAEALALVRRAAARRPRRADRQPRRPHRERVVRTLCRDRPRGGGGPRQPPARRRRPAARSRCWCPTASPPCGRPI
ncbi:MAG TPA: LysR substrate-binding domain-containing protein [Solirubrobacteraceae bacterium]|nr:LysR substrate-binding domain-containing protein [Solirubrobacteraceae bacterium]